jgi:hypothetical protein
MTKATVAILVVLALLLGGCKSNNDQKPVYFVPPTAIGA